MYFTPYLNALVSIIPFLLKPNPLFVGGSEGAQVKTYNRDSIYSIHTHTYTHICNICCIFSEGK